MAGNSGPGVDWRHQTPPPPLPQIYGHYQPAATAPTATASTKLGEDTFFPLPPPPPPQTAAPGPHLQLQLHRKASQHRPPPPSHLSPPQEMEIPFVTTPLEAPPAAKAAANCLSSSIPPGFPSSGGGAAATANSSSNSHPSSHSHHRHHHHRHHRERVSKGTTTAYSPPHLNPSSSSGKDDEDMKKGLLTSLSQVFFMPLSFSALERNFSYRAHPYPQVNISGLRAATDETRQRGRRLLWVFLLTVCFAVMVAQITDRVRHFLSEPVSVQVSVARNSSLTYPAITICNKVR